MRKQIEIIACMNPSILPAPEVSPDTLNLHVQSKYVWLLKKKQKAVQHFSAEVFTGYENNIQLMAYHLHPPRSTVKTLLLCPHNECVHSSLG